MIHFWIWTHAKCLTIYPVLDARVYLRVYEQIMRQVLAANSSWWWCFSSITQASSGSFEVCRLPLGVFIPLESCVQLTGCNSTGHPLQTGRVTEQDEQIITQISQILLIYPKITFKSTFTNRTPIEFWLLNFWIMWILRKIRMNFKIKRYGPFALDDNDVFFFSFRVLNSSIGNNATQFWWHKKLCWKHIVSLSSSANRSLIPDTRNDAATKFCLIKFFP